mgnify:CR=1 FL=1
MDLRENIIKRNLYKKLSFKSQLSSGRGISPNYHNNANHQVLYPRQVRAQNFQNIFHTEPVGVKTERRQSWNFSELNVQLEKLYIDLIHEVIVTE